MGFDPSSAGAVAAAAAPSLLDVTSACSCMAASADTGIVGAGARGFSLDAVMHCRRRRAERRSSSAARRRRR